MVLVDPYSTGGMLAPELDERGYAVIALWTQDVGENRDHLPQAAKGFPDICLPHDYLLQLLHYFFLSKLSEDFGVGVPPSHLFTPPI